MNVRVSKRIRGAVLGAFVGVSMAGCLQLPDTLAEIEDKLQGQPPAPPEPAVEALRMLDIGLQAARQFDFPMPTPPTMPPPPVAPPSLATPEGNKPPAMYCDATPDYTYVNLCGTQVASSASVAWSGCAAGPDGNVQTSGTLDMTLDVQATCGAVTEVTFTRQLDFDVVFASDREKNTFAGAVTVAGTQPLFTPSWTREMTFYMTSITDGQGAKPKKLDGSLSVAFTGGKDVTPSETWDGAFETHAGALKFEGVTRADPKSCKWPTAGQIVRTTDGQTHTLAFSATCGEATLDGKTINLDGQPQQQQQQPPPQ